MSPLASRLRGLAARAWRGGVRGLLPWCVAGAFVWFLAIHWIPGRVCAARSVHAAAERLERMAPRPEILRGRLDSAVRDSVRAAALRAVASARQAGGSDPSSQVAGLVVPRMESAGIRLQRVSAREEGGEVLLSLSVTGTWKGATGAFASLDSLPLHWTARRLNLRPADGSRLAGDLILAVPVSPEAVR